MDSTWERVQKIELKYHEQKDPAAIRQVNLQYWPRILAALPPGEVVISPATRILDVGCGGCGILLAVEGGTKTGVDPLMPYYLEKFPFLREEPVRWVTGMAEQFAPEPSATGGQSGGERFDVIFSINMLDHTVDPRAAAANLEKILAPGGRLVFLLNVHLTRFWRLYFEKLYRFVDPPHPHHIHIEDVPGYFPGLRLLWQRDADSLWLDLKGYYDEHVIHKKSRDSGKIIRKLANPFLYPTGLMRKVFNRPVYRRRTSDRSLMVSQLFLFAKD